MGKMITDPIAALGFGYQKHCLSIHEDVDNDGCNSCPFHKLIVSDQFGASYACAFAHFQKLLAPEQLESFCDGAFAARD